ncbi:MAG TPA: hypothetical protein VGN26_00750 [Armatimonadota bacterium]
MDGVIVPIALFFFIFLGVGGTFILRELRPYFEARHRGSPELLEELKAIRHELAELKGLKGDLNDLRRTTGEKLLALEAHVRTQPGLAAAPPLPETPASEASRTLSERAGPTQVG